MNNLKFIFNLIIRAADNILWEIQINTIYIYSRIKILKIFKTLKLPSVITNKKASNFIMPQLGVHCENFLDEARSNGLAIFTVVRNEASFLQEWIDFHLKQGVQFIYLFDHKSTDDTDSVVQPYINKNVLQRIEVDFEHANIQLFLFEIFLSQKLNYRWVMFIDIDEFVYHKEGQNLLEYLNKFSNESNLIFQWRNFGTSGFIRPPQGKIIENYRYSFVPKDDEKEYYNEILKDLFKYKSIVNPVKVIKPNVHICNTGTSPIDISSEIYCNHYITKSKYDFLKKLYKIARAREIIPYVRLRRIKMLRILDKNSTISQDIDVAS